MPTAPSAQIPPAYTPPAQLLQDVAAIFGLLSATVRLHIVWLLASGERDVGTLADEVGHTVATVSHHLAKLKLAGLVRSRREGKRQVYFVADTGVVELVRLAVSDHTGHREQDGLLGRRARSVSTTNGYHP